MIPLEEGRKVKDIKTGKIYDFGYIGGEGRAICYEEGECDMQSAVAIPIEELEVL